MEREVIKCSDCGAVCPPPTAECGASGYAIIDGRKICYRCADNYARLSLEEAGRTAKPFSAYVSPDSSTVTTWTGGALGYVTKRRKWSTRRCTMFAYRVLDVFGREWWGRGRGEGMCLILRRRAA